MVTRQPLPNNMLHAHSVSSGVNIGTRVRRDSETCMISPIPFVCAPEEPSFDLTGEVHDSILALSESTVYLVAEQPSSAIGMNAR